MSDVIEEKALERALTYEEQRRREHEAYMREHEAKMAEQAEVQALRAKQAATMDSQLAWSERESARHEAWMVDVEHAQRHRDTVLQHIETNTEQYERIARALEALVLRVR